MKRLHYLVGLNVVWFFLLYNIERLLAPIHITTIVYPFTAFCAILVLFLPRLQRVILLLLILLTLAVYFVVKGQLGQPLGSENLSTTIIEIIAIVITIVLSSLIQHRLRYLQEMLANVMVGQLHEEIQSFGTGQGQIYREIRRARRYQRPVSLLAISATDEFLKVQLEQFTKDILIQRFLGDVQRDFMRKYINTRIANFLIGELEDSAIVTQRNDHFVILLPETSGEDVSQVVKALESAADAKLSLKLRMGVSTFPDQAVTFETLLDQAEAEMMQQPSPSKQYIEFIPAETKELSSA